MLYAVSWTERTSGSSADFEATQKRILEVFRTWEFPQTLKVREFLVRLGEWGGLMLIETDDAAALHKMTSVFPAFGFSVVPMLPVGEAVQAELEAIAWRDGLSG